MTSYGEAGVRCLIVEVIGPDRFGPAVVRKVLPIQRCPGPFEDLQQNWRELGMAAGENNEEGREFIGRFALWLVDSSKDLHAFTVGDLVRIKTIGAARVVRADEEDPPRIVPQTRSRNQDHHDE